MYIHMREHQIRQGTVGGGVDTIKLYHIKLQKFDKILN